VTEAAPEPEAETPAEPVVQGSEQIQERGEDVEAVPAAEAVPEEPDHKGLLHELATITGTGLDGKVHTFAHVTELKAWLTSHGM
jgi:hypothetical protein